MCAWVKTGLEPKSQTTVTQKKKGVQLSLGLSQGRRAECFFPLPQLLRLTGKKQKVGGGMGGGDWLRARLTKNTASFVWTIKGKINPLIINLLSAKLYFIINK